MKKYLIVIMLCICTFTYGQVKNSKGQKMVSKVEVFNRNATTPFVVINFGYNNTKLNYISFKTNERQIVWNRSGSTLKRTEYDRNNRTNKNFSYSYQIDEDGNVSEMTFRDISEKGDVLTYDYHFEYENHRLSMIYKKVFNKYVGKPEHELSDRYKTKFAYSNGNLFESPLRGYFWREGQTPNLDIYWNDKTYYDDLANDTNIDFYQLYRRTNGTDLFEMVTEWINCRSDCLIEKYIGSDTHFDYTFDNEYGGSSLSDERGNIVQMDVYQMGRIDLRFKIYYVIE